MIKKPIKYLLMFILLTIMAALTLFVYIVYTESGSRWAINFAIEQTEVKVSYDAINGTLDKGLSVSNLKYQDEAVLVEAQWIEFQADWSLWSRQIDVINMQIKQVDLLLKNHVPKQQNTMPFNGFEWPVAINVENLNIHDLTLNNQQQTSSIQSISLQASADGHHVTLKDLRALTDNMTLQVKGDIHTVNGLTLDLKPTIEYINNALQVKSNGMIKGNLDGLHLNQSIELSHEHLNGNFVIQGQVQSWLSTPVFDVTAKSQQANAIIDQQSIEIHDLAVDLLGQPNDYQVVLGAELSKDTLPPAKLKFVAIGGLTQILIESAELITAEGLFDIEGRADWQNQLMVFSTIKLTDFNPSQILAEWSGTLDGSVNIDVVSADNGFKITSKNNDIKGFIKNQPVSINGDISYASDQIETNHLNISLGQNHIIAHGQLNKKEVDLDVSIDWPELSQLGSEFAGQATGKISIKGSPKAPELTANLDGNTLQFKGYEVAHVNLQSHGEWNSEIETRLTVKNLVFGNRLIDDIELSQVGWLDDHKVEILASHDQVQQQFSFTGNYHKRTSHWYGELSNHKLTVQTKQSIKLIKPVHIELSDNINIQPACWQGEEQGTFCLELTDTNDEIEGSVKVAALSLLPFRSWLPSHLNLLGKANGEASFSWSDKGLMVKSNLAVDDGQLVISQPNANSKQVMVFTKLELLAETLNNESDLSFELKTIEGDFINSHIKITQKQNGAVWLDGDVSGEIVNTKVIKELTSEINEISGHFIVNGEIEGPLDQPRLKVMFQQPSGYVRLSRLGAVIEKTAININTQMNKQPAYIIRVSGQNLSSINQGDFLAEGTLNKDKNNWIFQGQLSGENFMIFNMPELKLNISPKLNIKANKDSLQLSGDLVVDAGEVVVKQLPPNTISNSNDLIIHTANSENSNETYPLVLDINMRIKDRLKLEVIGLNAYMLGSMQIQQQVNQSLTAKGQLKLEDGQYAIYGQKLDINQGELIFNGAVDNPRIDVRASRKSLDGNVLAGVELGGTVNNLQSQLFSEPTLSDVEILSYIMTGNGINNAGSLNAEQLRQTAILLGLNQGAPVFRQIQNTFGIDVLTIKEASSTSDTVIEAGKKINDKLYVSYNHGIFNRLGFWVLKYKLNKFLNLQTTQGEDQSIELVYTRKSRNNIDNKNTAKN